MIRPRYLPKQILQQTSGVRIFSRKDLPGIFSVLPQLGLGCKDVDFSALPSCIEQVAQIDVGVDYSLLTDQSLQVASSFSLADRGAAKE